MLEFFLNPAYLAVGGALVSAPIIIHLINRMQFRRVRWAAMEFLLKSQKRNRRKLIMEQLLLLLLRCLLVLLAVLLVARFVGFNFAEFFQSQTSTLHVVVLDDSPSLGDTWAADGVTKTAFGQARELILRQVVQPAVRTPSPQHATVLALSKLATPLFDQPLNDQTKDDLQSALDGTTVSHVRIELLKGVEKARALFDQHPEARRYLHLVSDFRDRDWADADTSGLQKTLEGMTAAGIQVRLLDAAHPTRNELQRTPPYHDNLGVVGLRPETRLAAKDLPVEFEVLVRNFSLVEYKNIRVAVKVNGAERAEGSVTFPSLPPGTHAQKFQIVFDQRGFNQVTANLDREEAGLQVDNTHYTVVEVRDQVPILVVDGDPFTSEMTGGDLHYLRTLFASAKGYQLVVRGGRELEQPNLDQYPSIYLLNVGERDLNDKAVANLSAYVRNGGGLAVFLGPRVRDVKFYNEKLHASGTGFFPAPLAEFPSPRLGDPDMEGAVRLFLRDTTSPVLEELGKKEYGIFLRDVPIRRYWPINRRAWKPEPGQVQQLVVLPNQRTVGEYAEEARGFLKEIDLLLANREHEKYHPGLKRHAQAIRTALGDKPLADLGNALEEMLRDRGNEKDPQHPNLVELWDQRALQDLRGRLDTFRETVQYGDPLVLAKRHGRGRVVTFLTTLGSAPRPKDDNSKFPWGWHNWAGGSWAMTTFPVIILDMQKYLAGGGGDNRLTLGQAADIQVESSRYAPRLRRFFRPEVPEENKGAAEKGGGDEDRGEQIGAVSGGQVSFRFEEADKPGVYLFELSQLADENDPNPRTETRAYVYNLDPEEGDLRRAGQDELERASGGAELHNQDTKTPDSFQWQSSLSESPWFYVVFLIVLVLEQALAVHLSYHVKGQG